MTTEEALQVRDMIDQLTHLTDEQQHAVLQELTRRRVEARLRARRRRGIVPVQRLEEIPPA